MTSATSALLLGAGLLALAPCFAATPTIYRCAGESGVIYSDRPCEAGAEPHRTDDILITVYSAPSTPERASASAASARPRQAGRLQPGKSQPGRSSSSRPKSSQARSKNQSKSQSMRAAEPDGHRIRCARMDEALRDLRSQMRSGYDAAEGERLRARERQINRQRRAEKCD